MDELNLMDELKKVIIESANFDPLTLSTVLSFFTGCYEDCNGYSFYQNSFYQNSLQGECDECRWPICKICKGGCPCIEDMLRETLNLWDESLETYMTLYRYWTENLEKKKKSVLVIERFWSSYLRKTTNNRTRVICEYEGCYHMTDIKNNINKNRLSIIYNGNGIICPRHSEKVYVISVCRCNIDDSELCSCFTGWEGVDSW